MTVQYGANVFLPPSPVIPPFLVITNITRAVNAVVTVSTANQYVVGQVVYFSVPFSYGMFQINGLTGKILTVNNTNLIFTTNINSTFFDAFVLPVGGEQPATLAPSGASNIYNNTTVPFHSEGNFGN
jgi:hypothetical protein